MLRKTTMRESLWVGHRLWGAHGCSGHPEAPEESKMIHIPKASRTRVSLTPLYRQGTHNYQGTGAQT